jgi:glutamine amidotransferase
VSESVVVIDYGAGNLCSVDNALRVAVGNDGGATVVVSSDPGVIAKADRIVLPGVGAFGQCIGALREASGIEDALTEAVRRRGIPFLGICVGMQLLATEGVEHGTHRGLDWIGGAVARIAPADLALKVPHMGWNAVNLATDHSALAALPQDAAAYFVHSYAFAVTDPAERLATTDHGGEIAAIVGRDNILGVQFHPEKSQAFGLAVLRGFLEWRP